MVYSEKVINTIKQGVIGKRRHSNGSGMVKGGVVISYSSPEYGYSRAVDPPGARVITKQLKLKSWKYL